MLVISRLYVERNSRNFAIAFFGRTLNIPQFFFKLLIFEKISWWKLVPKILPNSINALLLQISHIKLVLILRNPELLEIRFTWSYGYGLVLFWAHEFAELGAEFELLCFALQLHHKFGIQLQSLSLVNLYLAEPIG